MKRSLVPAAVTILLAASGILTFNSCVVLMQACKTMEGEGKSIVGSTNRAQQSYYLEYGQLANSLDALKLGYPSETDWYKYSFQSTPTSAFFYAVPIKKMTFDREGYVGAVFLNQKVGEKANPEEFPLEIICEARGPKAILTVKPLLQNGSPICPKGSLPVK